MLPACPTLPAAWQVLVVFKTAPELCNLLKAVEEEYRRGKEGGLPQRSRLDGPYADVLPWIQSQAVVFETGAKASCRDVHTTPAVSCTSMLCFMSNTSPEVVIETAVTASCRDVYIAPAVKCSTMMCLGLNSAPKLVYRSETCTFRQLQ